MSSEAFAKSRIVTEAEARGVARERAKARRELHRRRAVKDCAAFIEYALRSEEDGGVIRNAPFHREWQRHLDENRLAVLIAPVEHGKTQQLVGRILWSIGNNPNLRCALISNTAEQAEKVLRAVRKHIEANPRVREVFPHLRPSPRQEDPWHTTAITVDRSTISKDPTVQALGLGGPINGSRIDLIVLDDVLDFDSTRTEEQRKKSLDIFDSTIFPRLYKGGRLYAIGTPWHPEDLLHVLEGRPGFAAKRYSAVENPDDPPERWRPIWPEQWDLQRLEERRQNMADTMFSRKYLCRVRLDSTSRFKEAWLRRMCALGMHRTLLPGAPLRNPGGPKLPCFTGVDLGIGEGENDALTVLFTIALLPNGRRLVVDIESGRWTAPEIIDRLASCYARYDSEILVENNSAQKFLVQMCDGRVPVKGHHTGSENKNNEQFGVESLAVEMRNGLWVLPSGSTGEAIAPEAKAWMTECLFYSPDPKAHTGDRLMASWIAREALRKYAGPISSRVDVLSR